MSGFQIVVLTVIATVIAGLILEAIVPAWRSGLKSLARRVVGDWRKHDSNVASAAATQRKVLLEQVEAIAHDNGIRLAVRASGHRPKVVHWSDGTKIGYFEGDHAAYKRAMDSGTVPPTATYPGPAPRTIRSWSDQELRNWLKDNA